MKSLLRLVLSLGWLAGVTALGGAIGMWIARRNETPGDDLHTATMNLADRQDVLFTGMGIGLGVGVIGLIIFTLVQSRSCKPKPPAQDGDQPAAG